MFEEGLGTLQGRKAKIHADPTATPIFHKARPVPYALREKIEQDLQDLKGQGPLNQSSPDNIEKVLRRLSEADLGLKAVKCQFMKPVLECLGHRGDAEAFHPVEAKVKAIQEAPAPKKPTNMKSFLGMHNFYGKFITYPSSILEPLHSLLRKDVVWKWGVEQ